MFKKLLIIIFFSSFLLLIPQKVFASDVVINEVLANPSGDSSEETEFIELYNKSATAVDISGWKLSDPNKTYTIPSGTSPISANGYLSFTKSTTGISLNNSGGETVTLKDSSDSSIDSMTFDSTIEDKSWSRIPNGTGDFVNNTSPTKDAANSAPPPTSTPTPTDAPTPTKTPTPAPSATPTKTPTPAPSTTPAKTPTPTVIKAPTTTPVKSLNPSGSNPSPTPDPNSSLSIGDKNNNIFGSGESSPTPAEGGQVLGASTFNSIPWLFIGLGLILLIVCGILAYFQFGDKIIPQFIKSRLHGRN